MTVRQRGVVLLLAAAGLGLGCTGSDAAPAAPRTHVIVVDKMQFGSVPRGIRVGDTIEWANNDLFRHNAIARDGSFAVDLPPRSKRRMVVRKAGTVRFYCSFHPAMQGSLAVAK